jgi:hypothetical protein
MCICKGVDKFFKTLAKLANIQEFSLAKSEKMVKNTERVSERGKTIVRLASGFVFLLANPEFCSHLASWRVVIFTPSMYVFMYFLLLI